MELGAVESDEAMARRLQREERERANASSRDAFTKRALRPGPARASARRPATVALIPCPTAIRRRVPPTPSSAPAPPPTAESTVAAR